MENKIILGNCLDKLKELKDNSVDSIVTDPPYELGFMGKKWDNTGIAYNVDMWKECLRVLKPGGYLLSFGGTRTYHRMAVAIEDAGFEVRDMIEWVYGSGFPKSLNIGKAVDKLQGNVREVVGVRTDGVGSDSGSGRYNLNNGKSEMKTIYDETKGNSPYEGWGTALKPAHEPICMARKPLLEKTVAENVLKYGTGGINIDESRIPTSETLQPSTSTKMKFGGNSMLESSTMNDPNLKQNTQGRFPANLIHDNSEEVRECFPETKTGSVKQTVDNGANQPINFGGGLTKERLADQG
ncbi:MAG: site-specific DNA-methyltransferase, partial [Spirochaetia bacterium]|nr:site-specific DNA-methyltransferase [Spirochaetia bacterium]